MRFGISESQTRPILERNLAAFGLKNAGGLILFGGEALDGIAPRGKKRLTSNADH